METASIVGLSEADLNKSPFDLSGGQKRRAAIAGVMAMEPKVLVLDEPAAGLDPEGRESIFKAIDLYRKKRKATVIIVSHSMEDMARWCDNIVGILNKKRFCISKSTLFRACHRMPADKTVFHIKCNDLFMDRSFNTAYICQNTVRSNQWF